MSALDFSSPKSLALGNSPLFADGYGLYGYLDVGGATPVVDECGGHFGYTTDSSTTPVYHYHTKAYGTWPMVGWAAGQAPMALLTFFRPRDPSPTTSP